MVKCKLTGVTNKQKVRNTLFVFSNRIFSIVRLIVSYTGQFVKK